eukprot:5723229-Amphidinium_carterae.1
MGLLQWQDWVGWDALQGRVDNCAASGSKVMDTTGKLEVTGVCPSRLASCAACSIAARIGWKVTASQANLLRGFLELMRQASSHDRMEQVQTYMKHRSHSTGSTLWRSWVPDRETVLDTTAGRAW